MANDALPPLRDVVRRYGLMARKSLGQNFLLDVNLTRRIARGAAPLAEVNIVEVGPGPGGLTRALLLEGARRVVAIEQDQRCLPALAELATMFPGRLEVVAGDALAIDPVLLVPPPRKIVANLPYNIATRLLLRWLPHIAAFAGLVLMFQKEVALRLAAAPASRDYGRLSVITQWRATVERLFDVAPTAFVPAPKVTSTVLRLMPRQAPLVPCEPDALERVTAAAFGQRRKMLRQSLKALGDASALLHEAKIAPTARAEAISVEAFCALARALTAAET